MKKINDQASGEVWKLIVATFVFVLLLIVLLIFGNRVINQNELKEFTTNSEDVVDELRKMCLEGGLASYHFEIDNYEFADNNIVLDATLPEFGEIVFDFDCNAAYVMYDNRNCVTKDYTNDLTSFRVHRRVDCVINEEVKNGCNYECDILGDNLNYLVDAVFANGMEIKRLPGINSNMFNDDFRIQANEKFDYFNLEGLELNVYGEEMTLLSGNYNGFPLAIEDFVPRNTPIILVTFVDTGNGNYYREYAWVFLIRDGQVVCNRIQIDSEDLD